MKDKLKESGGKLYSASYEDPVLRGEEEERPWDITEVVRRFARSDASLLDIGCGSCRKILPLVQVFKEIYGLEPSAQMREAAEASSTNLRVNNLHLIDGMAEQLPFPDEMFDVVTCFVAPHVTSEVHRVLKKEGVAIIEKLGDRDKTNIKEFFGEDEDGPRGQFLRLREGEREQQYREEFGRLFSSTTIKIGSWSTYLSRDGLVKLLTETNTVRDFDMSKDSDIVDKIVRRLSRQKGIKTTHQRLLIIASK